jgi:hypothetical protein
LIICIIFSISSTSAGEIKDSIDNIEKPERNEYWSCYDYTINITENNPNWKPVTFSHNMFFRGTSHVVNYRMYDKNTMIIYDGLRECFLVIDDWYEEEQSLIKNKNTYYRFWKDNETPLRLYKFLRPNTDYMYNEVINNNVSFIKGD